MNSPSRNPAVRQRSAQTTNGSRSRMQPTKATLRPGSSRANLKHMTDVNASRKTKIFISYSRKNKLFVRKLNDAMDQNGIEAWVDWEGIPLSSDWMAEITA